MEAAATTANAPSNLSLVKEFSRLWVPHPVVVPPAGPLRVVPYSQRLGSRERAADGQDLQGRRARIREGRSGMGSEGRRLARTRRGDRSLRRLGPLQGGLHGRPRRARPQSDRGVATVFSPTPLMPVEFAGHLVQADPVADRPPVRTGGGKTALQPALYQCLHLGLGEFVSHLYGGVAGYGGEDMVFAAVARLGARDGRESVLEGACYIPVGERGDHGRDPHGSRPERLGLEAVDGELFEVCRGPLGLGRREVDDLGDEKALHRRRAVRVVEPVQNGSLVGDVLVDDPEGFGLLDEDVAGGELPNDPQFLGGGLWQPALFRQVPVRFALFRERLSERPGSLGEPFARLLQTTRGRRCVRGAPFSGEGRAICRWTRGP